MTKTRILLGITLALFTLANLWALEQFGFAGTWESILGAEFPTKLILFDLLIALSLVMTWMWNDARERGATVWPYLLVTLALGSIGPLLYLIRRESARKAAASGAEHGRVAQHA